MLVKRFLYNKFNLDTFSSYFEIFDHKMNTKNNNHFYKIASGETYACSPRVFFAGGILYNSVPLELHQIDDILLFKRRLKEHFK